MSDFKPISESKRKRLEEAGYRIGDYADFLGMSQEEKEVTEIKLALCRLLVQERKRRRLSQAQLARSMKVSQPRVAKLEAADDSVGLDATLKALFTVGATRQDIAKAIMG